MLYCIIRAKEGTKLPNNAGKRRQTSYLSYFGSTPLAFSLTIFAVFCTYMSTNRNLCMGRRSLMSLNCALLLKSVSSDAHSCQHLILCTLYLSSKRVIGTLSHSMKIFKQAQITLKSEKQLLMCLPKVYYLSSEV